MSKIDKLRSTYPVPITFHAGEQPDAAKLSSISSQAKSGLSIIEKAIGDIWGTGTSEKGLHLTNLGRALGEAKYNNPALFNVGDTRFFYIENLGLSDKWLNKTTGYLTFRPANSTSSATDALTAIKFSDSTGANASTTHVTVVSDEETVTPNGTNVFVDAATGRFRTGKSIAAGDLVGYWVDPTEWIQGAEDFYPGIIPDPRCDVSLLVIQGDATNGYYFHVPNRAPIEADEADPFQKLISERRPVECKISSLDINDEENITSVGGYFDQTPRFWNSNASAGNFYRYDWPEKATLVPGSIHLWDNEANGIVEGLSFAVNGTTNYRIDITDTKGRLNWAITQTTPHTFYLITHGSSLSRTVWSLVTALANHDHTGVHYNESNLDHSTLLDLNSASNKDSVVWQKSKFPNDDHVQYLHRDGIENADDEDRDFNKGAMLGDFIIGLAAETGGSYLGSGTTNKIWFGDNAAGTNPSISASANQILNIDASVITTGYTRSTYFSAKSGTLITKGYTFDVNVGGGSHPDPSLLGFQYTNVDTPQYTLLINAPGNIEVNLDTNELLSGGTPSEAKFAINNGAGTEVFKIEESGDISGPSGTLTVAGDLTVTEDISADNVSLSERLDLDHANLLPTISVTTTTDAGNSVAADYIYAIQAKLLNGQYCDLVKSPITSILASTKVHIEFGVPRNTASYRLSRRIVQNAGLPTEVTIDHRSFSVDYTNLQLDGFQTGFNPGVVAVHQFFDGDPGETSWYETSLGTWVPDINPPATVDNTTFAIDTNASIETMGDIHSHGNLSNSCPEGNIAVAGIRFKSNSDTSSSSMITGIKQETISQTGNPIAPSSQVVSTIANNSFDTANKVVLSFRPAAAVPGSLSLDYWYVNETTDELVYALHSHVDPGGSNLTYPTSFVVVYIEHGDFYA